MRDPKIVLIDLLHRLVAKGWATGTGGGACLAVDGRTYFAPSGMLKDTIRKDELFVYEAGTCDTTVRRAGLEVSACKPVFEAIMKKTGATCVIHSHSINIVIASEFASSAAEVLGLPRTEMAKGLPGLRYNDPVTVPLVHNRPYEHELVDTIKLHVSAHTPAVFIRRHGAYVWGKTWQEAYKHTEILDYLSHLLWQLHAIDEKMADRFLRAAWMPK